MNITLFPHPDSGSFDLKKTIVILGMDSLIGKALSTAAERADCQVIGTSRRKNTNHVYLDVTWELDKWPDLPECDALVVCASMNRVEQCQDAPALSYAVNVEGLEKAIKKYRSSRTTVLFFSSAHVFSGKKPFCRNDDVPDPQNVLGEHKVLGEEMVLDKGGLVIRVTKVIDPDFPRFTDWTHRLKNGKSVEAFSNLMTSLVPLESLVKVVVAAIREDWDGIMHVSGPEEKSYYDIAKVLARGLGFNDGLVNPIQGEAKKIGRTHARITLHISERVRTLNVHLPDTETVVRRWCRDYMRNE